MTGLRRRIARSPTEPNRTTNTEATRKLVGLVKRATKNGSEHGPLTQVEALITIDQEEWVWQVVDRDVLEVLSHRLVFESSAGKRREILMTAGIDAAMDAAARIVELDGGCVLINNKNAGRPGRMTAGRPADYRGAVGRYEIVPEAEPGVVAAGDPLR